MKLGIDIGGKGGYCLINDGAVIEYGKMLMKNDVTASKQEEPQMVDFVELYKLITGMVIKYGSFEIITEDVHSVHGSSAESNFKFGRNLQAIIDVCEFMKFITNNGITYRMVQPKEWQKIAWKGMPRVKKKSSTGKTMVNDTKAISLLAAKSIFPSERFILPRCRVPNDGIVDAALMAHYGEVVKRS